MRAIPLFLLLLLILTIPACDNATTTPELEKPGAAQTGGDPDGAGIEHTNPDDG